MQTCPVQREHDPAAIDSVARTPAQRDDRKSARLAAEHLATQPGAQLVSRYTLARDILRNPKMHQAGVDANAIDVSNPDHAPVFYLDGELHRKKRGAIARFFTANAVTTRYRPVMQRTADLLMHQLQASGGGRLDDFALQMTVTVAAEIVGLTDSNQRSMSKRIAATLESPRGWLSRKLVPLKMRYRALKFYYLDVRPAIRERRLARKDDIISHLLDEGYSERAIMVECLTYAVAGMVTTREFIVMAAWHMLEDDALRARFLSCSEDDQTAILEEILRLEPVASMLFRRAAEELPQFSSGPIAAGAQFNIDVRAVNADESVVGACPYALDPDRSQVAKPGTGSLSFGHGSHRCPGSQVAIGESRIFLDQLLRLPGIKLERVPTMGWHELIMSYELRNAIIVCERATPAPQ
jgi:cytochrome P450